VTRLVDRMLLVGFEEPDPPDWLRRAAPYLGAVVLFGQNLRADADAARLATALRAEADVLVAVDEEGGDVTRLHYRAGSPTPGNHVLGAAGDPAATAAVAASIGAELRAAGILLDLAPDADVNTDPANPVIGVRSFGADPGVVSVHTAAWVRGLQGQGVAACVKHFPGHGDTRVDSHLELPTVHCDEATWRAVHLPPFAAAVEAGVQAVMTAHIRVPALHDDPATVSRRILVDLLRDEIGFAGVVITDALDMAAMAATYGIEAAAVAALAAGADALCLGPAGGQATYERVRRAVLDAVRTGALSRDRLEAAAARVDRLRRWTASGVPQAAPADDDRGAELVRRTASARGVPPLPGPPVVVELRAEPNPAVGAAGWDLGAPLAALGYAPLCTIRIGPDDHAPAPALAFAGDRPVVVVGRDVARHAWQRAVWETVRAGRPDAVLVDLGLPRPADLGPGAYVLVGGAARPNLRVAAELLVTGAGIKSRGAAGAGSRGGGRSRARPWARMVDDKRG
jgi:beta-N-acetylhexosaminidase